MRRSFAFAGLLFAVSITACWSQATADAPPMPVPPPPAAPASAPRPFFTPPVADPVPIGIVPKPKNSAQPAHRTPPPCVPAGGQKKKNVPACRNGRAATPQPKRSPR